MVKPVAREKFSCRDVSGSPGVGAGSSCESPAVGPQAYKPLLLAAVVVGGPSIRRTTRRKMKLVIMLMEKWRDY